MKKLLLALLLLVSPVLATSFTLDLGMTIHALKAKHDKVPPLIKLRRITAALAGVATIGDAYTTYRGLARGRCELNPVLVQANGCSINTTRFTLLKTGMLIWLSAGEEIADRLPHGYIWTRENIILNTVAVGTFGALAVHNELQK